MFALKPSTRVANRAGLVVRASAEPVQAVQNAIKQIEVPAALKPVMSVAVANVIMAMPASAEAGKLFDFNLTLPIMAGQFLLLMVFLDKFWFTPVGKVLDERDELIRNKLASVKGDTTELSDLQAAAEQAMKDARAFANKAVADAKASTQAEQNEKLAALKAQVDKELEQALGELEKERTAAQSSVDAQVEKLSAEIMTRVLPEGVTL